MIRAYWRDALCATLAIVGVVWLLLMGLDVHIGWPQ